MEGFSGGCLFLYKLPHLDSFPADRFLTPHWDQTQNAVPAAGGRGKLRFKCPDVKRAESGFVGKQETEGAGRLELGGGREEASKVGRKSPRW